MSHTFDRKRDAGLGDYTPRKTIAPTTETTPGGLLGDVQGASTNGSASGHKSQQPSLGEVIGGAIVLFGAVWLTGEILAELFGSSAELTAVEQQILASA